MALLLAMGAGSRCRGGGVSCEIFNTLFWRLNVWTFSVGLNVTTTTTKKAYDIWHSIPDQLVVEKEKKSLL